jgi:hypothetical protein
VSPVIILGLVLMWAVVLVPMWLRRHDEVEESRSVDKFSTAMSTLSSREGRPTQRNVQPSPSYRGTQSQHREAYAMKREAAPEVHVHVSGASAPEALAARRKRSVARRRRQLLLALAVSVLATLIAAVVLGGILLWSIQIVLDLGTITYFTHLRRMALHAAASRKRAAARRRDSVELAELERETSWDRPAPAWEEGITVHRGPVPATTASFASTGSAAAPVAEAIFDQTEPWDEVGSAAPVVAPAVAHTATGDGFFDQEDDYAPVASRFEAEPEPEVDLEYETEHEYSSERAARAAAHAAAEVLARGGKPWEPVPVPKPTYATKPVAPSRPVYEAPRERLLPPVESTIEMQADDDLEAILDRRWAVND